MIVVSPIPIRPPTNLNQRIHNTTSGFVIGRGLEVHAPYVRVSPEVRYTNWGSPHFLSSNGGLEPSAPDRGHGGDYILMLCTISSNKAIDFEVSVPFHRACATQQHDGTRSSFGPNLPFASTIPYAIRPPTIKPAARLRFPLMVPLTGQLPLVLWLWQGPSAANQTDKSRPITPHNRT